MSTPFDSASLDFLRAALTQLDERFASLPAQSALADLDRIEPILLRVADRLGDNYPYFHPLYAGQMLKPPHPIARLAYALATHLNPNNHALDGGRASSAMEREAVADLAKMFGWNVHLGHLTSGGTMANLEALWISAQLAPGGTILASEQAHYTHQRISQVLQLPFESVPCDRQGRMDLVALAQRLDRGGVATVIATVGTTAVGAVDPLSELLLLRDRFKFRLHADAAYGGYFTIASHLAAVTRRAFDALQAADSICIDPHKHGLQPYGCGCVLFADPAVGRFYKHQSPYTYFTSTDLHLGEISLECSRPGAAAVALWATQALLPLVPGGEFAHRLDSGRQAALGLFQRLTTDNRFHTALAPELDIVIWIPRATRASEASRLAERIFAQAAQRGLHLALATVPTDFFQAPGMERDRDSVRCLRSVLMKPEHLDWLDRIWALLDQATNAALSSKTTEGETH